MSKKLNLGCGNNLMEGYINIDKFDVEADMRADICELPFENESVEKIVAYQVIEHLPYWKTHCLVHPEQGLLYYEPTFFMECHRVLELDGIMITECPDLDIVLKRILDNGGEFGYTDVTSLWGEYHRPWDKDRYDDWEHQAGSLHINGFTWKEVQKIAEYVGFEVRQQTLMEKHPAYRVEDNLSVEWRKI